MWFLLGTVLILVDSAVAISSSYQTQVNVSWCSWRGLRANILRDTIFLDGGDRWKQKVEDAGPFNTTPDDNPQSTIYYLNLTTSFNTTSDFINVLNSMSVLGGSPSVAPNYFGGTMFANDNEFYLYGGMHPNTNSSTPQTANQVLMYAAHQYGPYRSLWAPGWDQYNLSPGVTRYITHGAAASAPSENLGFYFSGMRAEDWGDFDSSQLQSNQTADTLITMDMSKLGEAKWTNDTIPSYIPARANAELVWVPVSESGALVAIGGVVDPIFFFKNEKPNSSRVAESKKISPTFMETVSVFDVESKTWYLQKTKGDIPPQLTEFCSVLASAADGSSHNIYIYGGYDGLKDTANPSDDVYILSLPSFEWFKAYNGTSTHSRSGHRCIKVYPDQMLAVGGQHVDVSHCLEGGIIVNFNLNTLKFEDKYDPTTWSKYQVPGLVTKHIGGDSDGGATSTAPSSWTNSSLAAVFDKKYGKTVETYWPYNSTSNNASASGSKTGRSGFPSWAGGVIGAVLGLLIIAVLVGLLCLRRRHRQRKAAEAESEAREAKSRNSHPEWMYSRGQASPGPGPVSESTGMETTETGHTMQTSQTTPTQRSTTQPSMTQASTVPESLVWPATPGTVESGGGPVYEMHDSQLVELPTPFNTPSLGHGVSPKPEHNPDPRRGSQSPVSPQTPSETDSDYQLPTGHSRRPSSLSITSPMSIENVMSSRSSHFYESFDTLDTRRAGHRSEVSAITDHSEGKGWKRGSATIREDE